MFVQAGWPAQIHGMRRGKFGCREFAVFCQPTSISCNAFIINFSTNELLQKLIEILGDRLREARQLGSRSILTNHLSWSRP